MRGSVQSLERAGCGKCSEARGQSGCSERRQNVASQANDAMLNASLLLISMD